MESQVLIEAVGPEDWVAHTNGFRVSHDTKRSWCADLDSALFFAKRLSNGRKNPIYFKDDKDEPAQLLDDALELLLYLKYGK